MPKLKPKTKAKAKPEPESKPEPGSHSKAVETNPSMGCPLLCQWLKYWVVYGLMALMEANVETVAR